MAKHISTMMALTIIALCWAELCYRLYLYHATGSEPSTNHVEDHYFATMGILIAASGATLILATIARRPRTFKAYVWPMLGTLAGAAYVAALLLAHENAMIVTYSEWAAKFGP